jgi:Ankyrin repeats (3 copies)
MTRRARLLFLLLLTPWLAAGCGLLSEMLEDTVHEAVVGASRRGEIAKIALFAARGADLDEPDAFDNHWTPLQHAVHKEQTASVRVLLEWGANPDATQPGNGTPLFMAADSKSPAIVELLMNAGADVEWQGPGGRTPLTQAVSGGALWDLTDRPLLGGCRTETVRTFMTTYAHLRVPKTPAGEAAVGWARAHNCAEVLRLIHVN